MKTNSRWCRRRTRRERSRLTVAQPKLRAQPPPRCVQLSYLRRVHHAFFVTSECAAAVKYWSLIAAYPGCVSAERCTILRSSRRGCCAVYKAVMSPHVCTMHLPSKTARCTTLNKVARYNRKRIGHASAVEYPLAGYLKSDGGAASKLGTAGVFQPPDADRPRFREQDRSGDCLGLRWLERYPPRRGSVLGTGRS